MVHKTRVGRGYACLWFRSQCTHLYDFVSTQNFFISTVLPLTEDAVVFHLYLLLYASLGFKYLKHEENPSDY